MRISKDSSSWRAGGILRRDFRHDPGLPETEIPRRGFKKKKKHIHKYKHVWIGKVVVPVYFHKTDGTLDRQMREIDKFQYICESCGNRTNYPRLRWR